MEVTTAGAPKRPRAKPDTPAAAPKPRISVKPRATRKAPVDLTDMIATTAYFLAAERQFTPGHELEDWLEAERRVHAQLHG